MESFSEACENAQIRFQPEGFAPLDPLPGLCPGPTGGLGGPLDPRPNLLFSKMTLLFHFIMKTLQICKNQGLFGKGLTLCNTILYFNNIEVGSLSNIVGEGENALKQHFLLCPQVFSHIKKHLISFQK